MKTNSFYCFPCQIMWGLLLLLVTIVAQAQSAQGVIRGHVYQFDGITPIGNATVEAIWGTRYLSTSTNETGNYSLSLPEGSYKVRATAPGYARKYFNNVTPSNEATILNVTDGANFFADFNLTEGGAISGHIYQIDGVTPISNAEIFIIPALYYNEVGFRVNSSADGSYVVDGLALGQYKMQIQADGFALKYYENGFYWNTAKNINVIPPSTTSGINVKMDIEASVSGRVLDADGVTPIPGVSVSAEGYLGWGGRATSSVDGSYDIRGMRPDTYVLRVDRLPGWYAGEFYDSKPSRSTADQIVFSAGDRITGIDFTLDEGGTITGRVIDEASDQVIPGSTIFAQLPNGESVTSTGFTNLSGEYKINLKPGTYYLSVWGNVIGYLSEYYQDVPDIGSATPVAVDFKQVTSGIDFYLSRPASISGHVFEIDGLTPIAGANVFAFPVNPQLNGSGANTHMDGSYKIEGLLNGDYVVQATVTGHAPGNKPVNNVEVPNETPNININLVTYPYKVTIVGQNIVGAEGGSVRVSDTSSPLLDAGVDVQAGALSENTIINISEVEAPPFPSNLVGIGAPLHFGPEGLQFAQPVTLILPYKQGDLDNAGISDPNQLDVYTFNTTRQAWEKVTGPKTVDTNNRVVMIEVDHFSIFRLAVLTSSNQRPIANAGPDQTVRLGSPVTLDGSNSVDPDQDPSPLIFAWTKAAGPDVALTGADSAKPTFTPAVKGVYTFSLTVNDGQTNSAPDEVTITVPALGDLDGDGDVDQNDVNVVTAARNTPANGPNDLRDINGDMKIDALDARKVVTLCTRPRCAVQ